MNNTPFIYNTPYKDLLIEHRQPVKEPESLFPSEIKPSGNTVNQSVIIVRR